LPFGVTGLMSTNQIHKTTCAQKDASEEQLLFEMGHRKGDSLR